METPGNPERRKGQPWSAVLSQEKGTGIKNGCTEGLSGGGKKSPGESQAAGPRAEWVKNTDKLFLGNAGKTITAFNYPKFQILPSLYHQEACQAC